MEETESKPPETKSETVSEHPASTGTPGEDAAGLWAEGRLVPEKVREFAETWLGRTESVGEAVRILGDAGDSWGADVAEVMKPDHVVVFFENGRDVLVRRTVECWADTGRMEPVRKVATVISEMGGEEASPEAAGLMLGLSRRLAICDPAVARRLWEKAASRLAPGEAEASQAVMERIEVGELIQGMGEDDLAFWESCFSWDAGVPLSWESDGTRRRLMRIAERLRSQKVHPSGLQKLVPGCWWDEVTRGGGEPLSMNEKEGTSGSSEEPSVVTPPGTRSAWGFAHGLAAGVVLAPLAFIVSVEMAPEAGLWWQARLGEMNEAGTGAPATVAAVVAPEGRESAPLPEPVQPAEKVGTVEKAVSNPGNAPGLSKGVPLLETAPTAVSLAATEPVPEPQPSPTEADKKPGVPGGENADAAATAAVEPGHPNEKWREEEAGRLFDSHPAVERVHGMICRAPMRENLLLILGQQSVVPVGSRDYEQLLRALILKPPAPQEIRDVVVRQAARYLPVTETLVLVEKLTYPQSENRSDVVELADLVLALSSDAMTGTEVERLWSVIRKKPQPTDGK